MADFKLALTAGHYKYTANHCHKSLDPNETTEWQLNVRVANKVEKLLEEYDNIIILRTDDRTGESDYKLADRTTAANNFGADFYLSIHHNAGAKLTKAGGIEAYVYTTPQAASVEWQKDLYNALIAATGLKGNRVSPLARANLHEVRAPYMPSVLLELGYMDSSTDVPVILTEDFANKCAAAIVSVIVKRAGLKKKATAEKTTRKMYRVQVGAYREKANAEAMLKKIRAAGYDAFIAVSEE